MEKCVTNWFTTLLLKELWNFNLRIIRVRSFFSSILVDTNLHFPPIYLENKLFCPSSLFAFTSSVSNFDVIFSNFYNIRIIIVGVRWFYSHLLETIYRNRYTRHKNLIKALNNKHAHRELLSFKNFIYKEKCGYSQNERV